jgi:hypothetical protein
LEKITHEVNRFGRYARSIPEKIAVSRNYHFDGNTKVFQVTFFASVLLTAISLSCMVGLYVRNQEFRDQTIQLRMIPLQHPDIATWADTTYYRNPEKMEEIVKHQEAHMRALVEAEERAKDRLRKRGRRRSGCGS